MDAFAAYSGYMTGMIEAPQEGADRRSGQRPRARGGRGVDSCEDHQIVTEVLLLLIGGDETTRHTLSGGTRAGAAATPISTSVCANDLDLLPNAVEEMLRWTAPVKNMARTITADTEFHGTALKEGEKMILLFESANFDEKSFRRARDFQYSTGIRTTTSRSASARTSASATSWLGSSCSIMQTRRCSGCPICARRRTPQLPLRPANFVTGLEKMPVKFTPAKPVGT